MVECGEAAGMDREPNEPTLGVCNMRSNSVANFWILCSSATNYGLPAGLDLAEFLGDRWLKRVRGVVCLLVGLVAHVSWL